MAWCLIPKYVDNFKRKLLDGTITPEKLNSMSSEDRHKLFTDMFGEENATKVNAQLESKLLLKNWKLGTIRWAENLAGLKPAVKRGMVDKIRSLETVLSPSEEKAFLKDLVSSRLGINLDVEQANQLAELSKNVTELQAKANKDGTFKNPQDAKSLGINKVSLENYYNEMKLQAREGTFKRSILEKIFRGIKGFPGFMKSSIAAFDNSLWGRQGIKVLADPKTSKIWAKHFLKSWSDTGKQTFAKGKWWTSGDQAVMDSIKADIYSRPNSVNGKYDAGGYGLGVLSEEAYPTSVPEKIPILGRIFKASEVAYMGGALRLRADLADRIIVQAEQNGVNTLNKEEARPLGNMIGSLTGRGNLGSLEPVANNLNVLLFSARFLKSNIDTLLAPAKLVTEVASEKLGISEPKNSGERFARRKAAESTLRIIGTMAALLTLAKLIDPEAVEEDSRSTNFGKIKVFGHWVDISGGMAGLITLASKLVPTYHDGVLGFWKIDSKGEYVNMDLTEYGMQTPLDALESFFEGKLAPMAGLLRDIWNRYDYNGNYMNLENVARGLIPVPLPFENFSDLAKDPASSFPLGSMILDGLGFSTSIKIEANSKTKIVPLNKKISQKDLFSTISLYSQAFGVDPETTVSRIFAGQKIIQVSDGGIVVVARQSVEDSEAYKKAHYGGDTKEVKLDHTIPNKLGGAEDQSNWKVVSTSVWSSYTKTENALIQAVKDKKISLKDAQAEIVKFKSIDDTAKRKEYGEKLQLKYKNEQSFNLVRQAMAAETDVKLTQAQRKRLDEINKEIDDLSKLVTKKEKSKLISPDGTDSFRAKIDKLNEEGKDLLGWNKKPTEAKKVEPTPTIEPRNPHAVKLSGKKQDVVNIITKYADTYGVPKGLAIDIAYAESKLNPTNSAFKGGFDNKTIQKNGKKLPYSSAAGLFMINDATWKDLQRWKVVPVNSSKEDPELNAKAAMYMISKGYLNKWNASRDEGDAWGKYYPREEISKYYGGK